MKEQLVRIQEQTLTDGSHVYDVVNIGTELWSESDGRVIISAESEAAAQKIADAINEHAVAVYGDTITGAKVSRLLKKAS